MTNEPYIEYSVYNKGDFIGEIILIPKNLPDTLIVKTETQTLTYTLTKKD